MTVKIRLMYYAQASVMKMHEGPSSEWRKNKQAQINISSSVKY